MNKSFLALILSLSLFSCSINNSITESDKEILTTVAIQYAAAKVDFKNKEQVYVAISNIIVIVNNGTFNTVPINSVIDEYLLNSKLAKEDKIAIKTLITLAISKIDINSIAYKDKLVTYLNVLLTALK